MREIEVKCRVGDKQKLFQVLSVQGIVLSVPLKQHDIVYGWPGAKDNEQGSAWLRLRTENESKHIFTLKKSVIGHLDSTEHETEVTDPSETLKIFQELSYTPYSDLTKIRQKAKHGDIEICIDEVPGLGVFVEAEKLMGEGADHDQVVSELWAFLKTLGLDKKDEVHEGYDVMERRLRGL